MVFAKFGEKKNVPMVIQQGNLMRGSTPIQLKKPIEIGKRATPGFQEKQFKILTRPNEDQNEVNGFLNMVSNLFVSSAKPSTWRATHLEAEVSVDGLTFFPIGVALFDSGASSDDYISLTTVLSLPFSDA